MMSVGLSQGVSSLGRGAEAGWVAQSCTSAGPGGRGQGLVVWAVGFTDPLLPGGVASGAVTWRLSKFLPGLGLGRFSEMVCRVMNSGLLCGGWQL